MLRRWAASRPNGFGLYDLIGNAWEWVADCYGGLRQRANRRQPLDGRGMQ